MRTHLLAKEGTTRGAIRVDDVDVRALGPDPSSTVEDLGYGVGALAARHDPAPPESRSGSGRSRIPASVQPDTPTQGPRALIRLVVRSTGCGP